MAVHVYESHQVTQSLCFGHNRPIQPPHWAPSTGWAATLVLVVLLLHTHRLTTHTSTSTYVHTLACQVGRVGRGGWGGWG